MAMEMEMMSAGIECVKIVFFWLLGWRQTITNGRMVHGIVSLSQCALMTPQHIYDEFYVSCSSFCSLLQSLITFCALRMCTDAPMRADAKLRMCGFCYASDEHRQQDVSAFSFVCWWCDDDLRSLFCVKKRGKSCVCESREWMNECVRCAARPPSEFIHCNWLVIADVIMTCNQMANAKSAKQLKFNYAHVEVKWQSTVDEQDSIHLPRTYTHSTFDFTSWTRGLSNGDATLG